jgi:hypothetical protein
MAARFKVKRKGIGEMLRMPGMEAEMLRRAEVIKGEQSAPRQLQGELGDVQ